MMVTWQMRGGDEGKKLWKRKPMRLFQNANIIPYHAFVPAAARGTVYIVVVAARLAGFGYHRYHSHRHSLWQTSSDERDEHEEQKSRSHA